MGRTLLIGSPAVSWREWLKEHRENRDLLCLDPAEGWLGPPARLVLLKGQRPAYTRFYGSLDALKAPHVLIASLTHALTLADNDAIVLLFDYRPSPLSRQIVSLVAQLLQPSTILIPPDTPIDQAGFPVGPEEVELQKAFPLLVRQAQRKAQWMKLLESCSDHEVDLRQVTMEGARLGSGEDVTRECESDVILRAEKCGNTLLIVSAGEPDPADIARALDTTRCNRAHLAPAELYTHLLCSFARPSGEDFGTGMIQEVDWQSMRAVIRCSAIAPAPVRILRLGSVRVDPLGNELGELKPWQV